MRVLIILLMFGSAATHADVKTDIVKCVGVESGAKRLMCFDDLAKGMGIVSASSTDVVGVGKWVVRTEVSKIDDSTKVYLSLDADKDVNGKLKKSRPTMIARCSENKTEIFINVGVYLGIGETSVLTRADKGKAIRRNWSISTDNEAIFYPGRDISFIKELLKRKALLVQLTPYGESPSMFEFDLAGLTDAIKPLRKACHW